MTLALAGRRRVLFRPAIASFALMAALLGSTGSQAWAEGNVRTGGWLTRAWCGSCHGLDNRLANDAAASLETIARRSHDGQEWTRAWLADPHPPMPNLTLSRSEIDDIIAYLGTLPTQ